MLVLLGADTHLFPVHMYAWVIDCRAGCDGDHGDHEEVDVGAGLTGVTPLLPYPHRQTSCCHFCAVSLTCLTKSSESIAASPDT